MPVSIPVVDLSSVGPSPAELSAARTILKQASKGELRSKMGSLSAYLKNHPEFNKEGVQSRGDARVKYLEAFLAHQARCKTAQKQIVNDREHHRTDKKVKDVYHWSRENGH